MESDENNIGKNIVYYRTMKGLSQTDLGKLTQTSRTTVSLWERGEKEPTETQFQVLADIFGTSIESIMSEGRGIEDDSIQYVATSNKMISDTAGNLVDSQERLTQAIEGLFAMNKQKQMQEEQKRKDQRHILLISAVGLGVLVCVFIIYFVVSNRPPRTTKDGESIITAETSIFLEEGG
ncbi:MAG: helix-turn-helix domain-containing protein [Clostridiales bacterium]|nr:helix-turn-helix domain-containing protein [Clostridiales bacterium]